ncbi:MAG: hypothetical protein HKP45_02710, partial [Winogradskyella sp.]|nr:hypothetical protein [Winogradskyella sp.]
PDYLNSIEQSFNSLALNFGSDETFVNTIGTHYSNIERVDFVFQTPLTTATPANSGFAVFERNGNDNFQIAAVTGLDGSNNPLSFGPLVQVTQDKLNDNLKAVSYSIMVKEDVGLNFRPSSADNTQQVQGAYVSFQDLGIGANQLVYGYVIMANDVTAPLLDWTDAARYPTNTTNASGMDLMPGGAAFSSDGNLSLFDACDAAISGNVDGDGDNVSDICDADSDNDGILNSFEGICVSDINSDILGTIGAYGSAVPASMTYPVGNTDITYTLTGVSPNFDVESYNAGLQGDAIRINASGSGSGTLEMAFNSPVYNVRFKLTDFDAQEDYTINVYDQNNVLVNLTSSPALVSVGSYIAQSGNNFVETTNAGDSDGNDPAGDATGGVIFDFDILVSRIELIFSHNQASSIRFTEVDFCEVADTDGDTVPDFLDLDSDNDGIYDVNEAGNSALDTNGDGVINSSDGGYADTDSNGADDTAEATTPIDTLTDGSYDLQNTDSDGDLCPDANEAYNDITAAGSDGGQFGDPDPASVNLANGLVTETGVDYSLGTNAAVADSGTNICDCTISALTISNVSACNDNGTPSDTTDDFFTADFEVTFAATPPSGNLELSSDVDGVLDTVDASTISSPYTFVAVQFPADGATRDMTAEFTADTSCTITEIGLVTAPFECSDDACDDVIPPGNPSAAISSADVTLNITGTGGTGPAILNSIAIAGEPNPFAEYYNPTEVNYQFANPDANSQFILDQDVVGANVTQGPAIFDPALLDAFADRDLMHWLSMDATIRDTDFNEIYYDAPIASAPNRYVVVTERQGNNDLQIEAIDATGTPIGTPAIADVTAYFDSGIDDSSFRDINLAIFPLTALVPGGTDIYGIRITQIGAPAFPGAGDGGDHKAFIIYDSTFFTPPPTIESTTFVTQPTCPTGQGSITVDATDNGGGVIEYSLDGTNWQVSNVFNNLDPGSYNVSVRYQSATNCQATSRNEFVVNFVECPALVVTKSILNRETAEGETIDYIITVEN